MSADSRSKYGQKRKKSYYIQAAKGKRGKYQHILEPGLKGFLITCNNREKDAIREAYNLLNEYADVVAGPEKIQSTQSSSDQEDSSDSDEDVESALQKEISSLKSETLEQKQFQVADTGANNCIFIKTTVSRPDLLVYKLFSDLQESKNCKSRYIMRLQPVVGTCRADDEAIEKMASDLLPVYFGTGDKKSYCVLSKIRNNSSFGKQQSLPILRRQIQELNPLHHFDPDNPDYIISMDIIKTVCCMSIMQDYFKFRKYNMQEVTKEEPKTDSKLKLEDVQPTLVSTECSPVGDSVKEKNQETSVPVTNPKLEDVQPTSVSTENAPVCDSIKEQTPETPVPVSEQLNTCVMTNQSSSSVDQENVSVGHEK